MTPKQMCVASLNVNGQEWLKFGRNFPDRAEGHKVHAQKRFDLAEQIERMTDDEFILLGQVGEVKI